MKEFSDKEFWGVVSKLLELKAGLGSLLKWNRSMIENFIIDFLDGLENRCKTDLALAKLCGIPVVRGELMTDSLTFSYDSFRRIFLTGESKGNKTTKNMFSVYLGFNNYTDLWVKELTKYQIQFDPSEFNNPKSLFENSVTPKLAQYFELVILSITGLAKPPNKPLLKSLSEKEEIDVELLVILQGLYFFSKKEWYLASDSFNDSRHFFLDNYQFYFLAGISFYKIKYGGYGSKQSELYLEKTLSLLKDDVNSSIRSWVHTYYGAILMHNKKLDESKIHLTKGLKLAEAESDFAKVHYYLSRLSGKLKDTTQLASSTDFLRENSGKYYALTMSYLKKNENALYEKIKFKGSYEIVDFDKLHK